MIKKALLVNRKFILILVLLLGLVLRTFEFGKIPAGIYVDEAAQGYNAYSILTTGKDEYGKEFPVFLRSFGTYASSLYSYLTIPLVALIGLNEISLRFISLISGTILVLLISLQFGLIAGLVVALSPIFIFTSRAAFEANLGLMLLVAGSVLSLRAVKNHKLLLVAPPLLVLSSYGYHGERFLSVILVVFFYWKYWKILNSKLLLSSIVLSILVFLPILSVSFSTGANARLFGLEVEGIFLEKVLSFFRLYLAYFSPNNLFSKPDPDLQRSFSELSVFYWWMVFPLSFGVYKFVKDKLWKETFGQFILIVLFFTPILAALTKDYFSTIRVLPFFIGISILIAYGLRMLVRYKFIYLILIIVSIFEIYSNLILLKHQKSSVWNYEYKELFGVLNNYQDENIVIEAPAAQPVYILEAFYNRTDPKFLQNRFSTIERKNYYSQIYFEPNIKVKNIEYRQIVWKEDIYKEQILVADKLTISENQIKEHKLKILHEITDINNEIILRILKTDPVEKCKKSNFEIPEIKEKCSKYK